jgi:predicted N-acetyltransferase YhbS
MSDLKLTLQQELPGDAETIERLHERAFGPGRFARAAERVREQARSEPGLSFVARVATLVVGSVRLTPIHIGETKALMLGPLAVEPAFRSRGIGRALLEKAIAQAEAREFPAIMLVGDESYYGRLGFKRVVARHDCDARGLWTRCASCCALPVEDAARASIMGLVRGG